MGCVKYVYQPELNQTKSMLAGAEACHLRSQGHVVQRHEALAWSGTHRVGAVSEAGIGKYVWCGVTTCMLYVERTPDMLHFCFNSVRQSKVRERQD